MENELIQLEGIGMKSEFPVHVKRERNVFPGGEQHMSKIEAPEISPCSRRLGDVVKREVESAAVDRQRDTEVSDVGAAVAQLEFADLQVEKSLLPGLAFGPRFARRYVAVTVAIDGDGELWAVQGELIERKLTMEERKDAYLDGDVIRVEEWLGGRPFQSVQSQPVYFHTQLPWIKAEPLHFHASPGAVFNRADCGAAKKPLRKSVGEDDVQSEPDAHGQKEQETDAMFPMDLHEASPGGMISIFRRSRVSSSHFAEWSSMAL